MSKSRLLLPNLSLTCYPILTHTDPHLLSVTSSNQIPEETPPIAPLSECVWEINFRDLLVSVTETEPESPDLGLSGYQEPIVWS